IPVYHIENFIQHFKELKPHIGILTVPPDIAQETADFLIQNGIRAIWNFTPFRIRVPEHIVLQNTSLYAHLAVMYNRLSVNTELDKE
ncbi:MAG: redox-sensing transcriptional repressor Rex, partial [Dysgonamonadaceae bacterium]|nr:redox-sensing transcriptional repressor Rex [Dysgonamonadaceae bacterium]MDD4246489.1 redox-sensing transcriptional repressor Rex [Dysgonamonadaceae bacterium]